MKTYRISLISGRSISLDSTFKCSLVLRIYFKTKISPYKSSCQHPPPLPGSLSACFHLPGSQPSFLKRQYAQLSIILQYTENFVLGIKQIYHFKFWIFVVTSSFEAYFHMIFNPFMTALHRQNTKISKQIFPEKEYRGLSPNFHIHASVSDLYIPKIGLPILLEEICIPILGLYKSLTDTWMWKLGLRPRYSQKRNI